MSPTDRVHHTEERPGAARRRLGLFAVLLALTVAGGVAARMAGGPAPGPGDAGGAAATPVVDPDGAVRLGARVDRTRVMRGGDGLVNLELTIAGADAPDAAVAGRTPTDLIVVLDRSGSMQGPPISHAIASVRRLIDSLDPGDRFALVTYASSASTTIPLAPATDVARHAWSAALSRIGVGGGTHMASGLDLADAEIARARRPGRAARIVLISDGHANEGDHSREGLLARTRRAVPGEYVVSTVGVGHGFDESLMTALADAGTGNFYFVSRADDLGDVFAGEFASARTQLASALRVEIRPEPGVRVLSAAGYPLIREGEHVVFHPGSLFAGQERRIWLSFRVPTGEIADATARHALGTLALRYVRDGAPRTLELASVPDVEVVAEERDFLAGIDGDAWAAAVAEDALGALKQEVSRALQRGDTGAALSELRSFRVEQAARNKVVASPAVVRVLQDVVAMEKDVDEAERAADAGERNRLSKRYSAEGYDGRRPGAKYEAP